jgi:hypothetical protein
MVRMPQLVLGVDTHRDLRVAVLLDGLGRWLATASLPSPALPTASWWPGPVGNSSH